MANFLRKTGYLNRGDDLSTFNMTPIIDIVFLLIIFFLVICRFIESENFPVNVPSDCEYAQDGRNRGQTTVTVMKTDYERSGFAVGSERIVASSNSEIVEDIAGLIDIQLKDLPLERRIVTLRVDKDVCYADAQYALAAIAASSAKDVQLATIKDKSEGNQ